MERLLLISEVLQYNFIEEVYLQKLKSTDENIPCIVIPVKEKGIDTSQLPNELLEWLKQQLLDQSKNRGRQFGSLDNVLQGILYHNNLFMSAR